MTKGDVIDLFFRHLIQEIVGERTDNVTEEILVERIEQCARHLAKESKDTP